MTSCSDGGRRFEEIEHTADVAIRAWGRDLAELFVNAACGMACQLANPDLVAAVVEFPVALRADDAETLLVSWLGELLYLGEREGCVFVDFDVYEISPNRLRAVARGGPVQEYGRAIKAVTFSGLEIVRVDGGYEATVVFDV